MTARARGSEGPWRPIALAGAVILAVGAAVPAAQALPSSGGPDAPAAVPMRPTPGSTDPADATVFAVPPAGVNPDAAPVVQIAAPSLSVIARSGSSDGAMRSDSGAGRQRITLSGDVNFETDSANLTPRAQQILDEIVGRWGSAKPASVTIVGHTDSVADDAYNQSLSEQRAHSVADYLTRKAPGLSAQPSGKGETQPVASETKPDGSVSEEGRAANRRVEITWQQ